MQRNTYLADCIDSTEYESRYDHQAKVLTANRQVLARIVKNTVEGFEEYDLQTIENCIEGTPEISTKAVMPNRKTKEKIIGNNTESTIAQEGTVRYDIRFYIIHPGSGERIKVILNIEIQRKYHLKYHLVTRGVFYCARMLSEQADTEFEDDNYQDIKKVYSIWICTDVPEKIANTISEYKITKEDVYGEVKEKEYYDLLTVVMIRLSGKENAEKGNELIKMLTTLFSHTLDAEEKKKKLDKEFGMRMTQELKGEIKHMCNLSQGVKEYGIQQGLQQGLQQGIQQGVQRGILLTKKESLLEVLEQLGVVSESLSERIKNEENLEILKGWFTIAIRSDSLDQFLEKTNIGKLELL